MARQHSENRTEESNTQRERKIGEYRPSIEQCAKQGRPFIELPYEKDLSLRKLVVFFAAIYKNAISAHRMQLLVFYADYRYYQLHGEQLTDAEYKPYAYGMHSKQIEVVVEQSPLEECRRLENGSRVTAYLLRADIPDTIEGDLLEFFTQMYEETREVSTDNLKDFSRNVPMFEKTEYEEIAVWNDETVASMDSYTF